MDIIVNLSVNRREHASAFDVNCAGTYHCLLAAVASGHRRFVNTAPHFSVIGSGYEDADFRITEEAPPHPGVNLYAISKGLGVELCRVFSRNHPLEVLCALFYNLPAGGSPAPGAPPDVTPFSVTFPDAAQAILDAKGRAPPPARASSLAGGHVCVVCRRRCERHVYRTR